MPLLMVTENVQVNGSARNTTECVLDLRLIHDRPRNQGCLQPIACSASSAEILRLVPEPLRLRFKL